MFEPLENLGVEHLFGQVERIEDLGATKKIVTDDGEFEAKTVVIATGSNHRPLNVPGEEELNSRGFPTVLFVMVLSLETRIF